MYRSARLPKKEEEEKKNTSRVLAHTPLPPAGRPQAVLAREPALPAGRRRSRVARRRFFSRARRKIEATTIEYGICSFVGCSWME
ncbi:hypothetical protein BHM03_00056803 [Ensete ventricosum]|nr:hypothetical protein BHM03_00056803 [Ensete ventricosum]